MSNVAQQNTTPPARFNGVAVADLEQAIDAIRETPEVGILTFETRTHWLGGMRTRSEVTGFVMGGQAIERRHTIECDEPLQILGNDEAPNPQELFLSAVGSCVSAIWAIQATKVGVTLRSLEVHMRGTLDMRGPLELADVPRGFPEVECIIHVDADATPETMQEIHEAVQRTSPNFYHLTTAIPARAQLVLRG